MKKFFVLMFLGLGLFFQSSHAVYQIGTEDWIPVAEEMSREDAKLHQAAMVIILAACGREAKLDDGICVANIDEDAKQDLDKLFCHYPEVTEKEVSLVTSKGLLAGFQGCEFYLKLKEDLQSERMSLFYFGSDYTVNNENYLMASFSLSVKDSLRDKLQDKEARKRIFNDHIESIGICDFLKSMSADGGYGSKENAVKKDI